jgi:crotonobetainyl-CoA:carnitine CoA-transferase CaiB-like acyl-CoA transferase
MTDSPLSDVCVIEFAEGVAGPMTARLLGDAGADVVKVETPGGDRTRGWAPQIEGTGVAFRSLNRNKRSIVVDPPPSNDLFRLIGHADVLIVDDHLVDVAALMQDHPHVIVCVISAWGSKGPWAGRPGGELAAQLTSEATSSLGRIGDEPVRLGADHASMQTAFYAMQAVIAALIAFDGGGQRIDVSLFGSLIHMRSTMWAALSNPDEWKGFHLDSYVKPPEYGYKCKERRMYFSVGRVDDIRALVRDLKMEFVFDDPRWPMFSRDTAGGLGRYSHVVHDLWDRGLSQWTFDEATEIIHRHGGWVFPCFTYSEFVADGHVETMGLIVQSAEPSGDLRQDLRPPWQFSETPASIRRPAPSLDQHGAEIRTGLDRPRRDHT